MTDIVIVGAGLAGITAALRCRAQGAQVGIASRGYGATSLSCGALEIAHAPALAQAHGASAALSAHLQDVVRHHPRHPFGQMGLDVSQAHIEGGYHLLGQALAGTGLDVAPQLGWAQRNALSISSLGCLVPSAMPLGPHRGWSASSDRPWGVVQIAQDPHFQAARICMGIRHDAQTLGLEAPDVRPYVIDLPSAQNACQSPYSLAQAFDDREVCGAFGRAIRAAIGDAPLAGLIVPPVLGLAKYRQARLWLSEDVGLPVIEALAHLPGVPGLRLQRALDAAAAAAGVVRLGEVTHSTASGSNLERLHFKDGSTAAAAAFVLASGRFVAGGVTWTQEVAEEALFHLPLVTELGPLIATTPQSVVRESPAEAHPLMTAGVQVSARLQPMRAWAPAYNNLFAAGMVLGGFSARYLLCADGVALASGHMAAEGALSMLGAASDGAATGEGTI